MTVCALAYCAGQHVVVHPRFAEKEKKKNSGAHAYKRRLNMAAATTKPRLAVTTCFFRTYLGGESTAGGRKKEQKITN